VLREARKQQYWPVRRCFEQGLLRDQRLQGKVHVQFVVRHTGMVRKPHSIGTSALRDAVATDCVAHSFSSLRLPVTTRGDATVRLDVSLYPGDLPVRSTDDATTDSGPGTLDASAAQAVIASSAARELQRCYDNGLARVAGLWGRMALRVDLAADGAVRDVTETESTFPDPDTTRCAADVVRKIAFPAPDGGDLRFVVPVRFGTPLPETTAK
jgi:TonB family protein